MQHTKTIQFQIYAEMVEANGIMPGTRGWLGAADTGFPHWTMCQTCAYAFLTRDSAAHYYSTTRFGGLYRPKANTVIIAEQVIEETVTEISCMTDDKSGAG
jgi:hypothetical protein